MGDEGQEVVPGGESFGEDERRPGRFGVLRRGENSREILTDILVARA